MPTKQQLPTKHNIQISTEPHKKFETTGWCHLDCSRFERHHLGKLKSSRQTEYLTKHNSPATLNRRPNNLVFHNKILIQEQRRPMKPNGPIGAYTKKPAEGNCACRQHYELCASHNYLQHLFHLNNITSTRQN